MHQLYSIFYHIVCYRYFADQILEKNNFKVHLANELSPTPLLWAVRNDAGA